MIEQIKLCRMKIDHIDDKIVDLVNERAKIVSEVGRWKHEKGKATFDRKREKEILDRVKKRNNGLLEEKSITKIIELIIKECRKMEKNLMANLKGKKCIHGKT